MFRHRRVNLKLREVKYFIYLSMSAKITKNGTSEFGCNQIRTK
jgi:hypothetical protein